MNTKQAALLVFFLAINVLALYGLTDIVSNDAAYEPIKLSQYSDRHITKNAVEQNPKFAAVAFAEPSARDAGYSEQFASIINSLRLFLIGEETLDKDEHGTWLWTPVLQMTEEYKTMILDNAKKEGVNTVYLSIDSYLDIFVMPEGEEKKKKKQEFSAVLDKFIALANERGIEVDAECGWRNWAEEGHTYKPLAIVSYVMEFNENHQNRFRGIQYDIEPYLLEDFSANKVQVMKRFVKLVDQTEQFIGNSGLLLSIVIPEFYDKRDGVIPVFSYGGKRDSVLVHLLDILDERKDSSIIVMSYRNFADGKDGSIDISKNEMRTANLGAYSTRMILAQETGDVLPEYVTFYNTSKPYYAKESELLKWTFYDNRSFGGMAVHYANAFFELK